MPQPARRILGRTGSKAELAGWAAQLPAGATALSPAVVLAIENSVEARSRLVASWYATYLGRATAPGEGARGWNSC